MLVTTSTFGAHLRKRQPRRHRLKHLRVAGCGGKHQDGSTVVFVLGHRYPAHLSLGWTGVGEREQYREGIDHHQATGNSQN